MHGDDLLEFVVGATNDAVLVVDANGRIQQANRAASRLLGLPEDPDVLLDRALAGRDQPDRDVITNCVRTLVVGRDITVVPEAGGTLRLRLDSCPLGDRTAVLLHDLTERYEAQEVLADVQQHLRDLQALGRVGLWRWDAASDEVQWSPQMYEIHGLDPLRFSGSLADHVAQAREDHRDRVLRLVRTSFEGGRGFATEYAIVRHDGEERWVRTQADITQDPSRGATGLTGIVQDVTEHREALQSAEEANERLERFAATIAHDLKDPLLTIAGYAELLVDGGLPGEDRALMSERLVLGVERAQALVSDILEASRSRRETGPVASSSLGGIIDWVRDTLEDSIRRTGSSVDVVGVDVRVAMREGLLRQCLLNLVGNALKYGARAGGARIRITGEEIGDRCRITVADDGPGIPEDERQKVFEDGYRLARDVDAGIDGTGIGLATVLDAVHRHGGRVEILDSDLGGAAFAIELPRARAAQDPPTTEVGAP